MATQTPSAAESEGLSQESPDGPLLDSTNQGVKRILAAAKERATSPTTN